ncbi:MAG: hypothetical protein ACR2MS_00600 [Weeksellaceae bacterium]
MKLKHILTLIISLGINILIFGQENTNETQNSTSDDIEEVIMAEMAIYPGCERYKGKTEKLTKCFDRRLHNHIMMFLNTEFPQSSSKKLLKVQFEFIVNTDGEITDIKVLEGDYIFRLNAYQSLVDVSEYLKTNGLKITPAKLEDGSSADLTFQNSIVLQNPDYHEDSKSKFNYRNK